VTGVLLALAPLWTSSEMQLYAQVSAQVPVPTSTQAPAAPPVAPSVTQPLAPAGLTAPAAGLTADSALRSAPSAPLVPLPTPVRDTAPLVRTPASRVSSPLPSASASGCPDTLGVVKLADYAVPGGRVVTLRFATGCLPAGSPTPGDSAPAVHPLSPIAEATLAAHHAGAAAEAAADAAKPSRREAFVALLTAVAVLLLK
jgi:hypothetical protein